MRILLTNDDGVDAPGLIALHRALRDLAEVSVLAPDRNWSASGHQRTLHSPLRVRSRRWPDGTTAYSTDGTPSDCVTLALLGVLKQRPALVVAGINRGGNLGHDVLSSGTVAAAMEATVMGVPAIAFSLNDWFADEFDVAAGVASAVFELVRRRGAPGNTMLNVNIPAIPREQMKGISITRLGSRTYNQALVERQDPFGVPYYWIGGVSPEGNAAEEGTDFWAMANDRISITPLSVNRTSEDVLEDLKDWQLED